MPFLLVVAPETEPCRTVRSTLDAWAAAGVLSSFGWWAIEGDPTAADKIDLVNGDDCRAADLAEVLKGHGQDFDLIALMMLDSGHEMPREFPEQFQQCHDIVGRVVTDWVPAGRTGVVAAPSSEAERVDPELFGGFNWPVILVVPEDRSKPDDTNRAAVEPGTVPALAALALSCLTESFVCTDRLGEAPLQTISNRTSLGQGDRQVQPIRCYSRLVDAGYLVDHVAAEAFEMRTGLPALGPSEKALADVYPTLSESQRKSLASRFTRKHRATLRFDPIEPEPVNEQRYGLLEALRRLWNYLLVEIASFLPRLAKRTLDRMHDYAARLVERVSGQRVRRSNEIDRLPIPDPEPEALPGLAPPHNPIGVTWHDMVRLIIALADAEEPPAQTVKVAPEDPERMVVRDPRSLVPDPALGAIEIDGRTVRICDSRGVAAVLADASPTVSESVELTAAEGDEAPSADRAATRRVRVAEVSAWADLQRGSLAWEIGVEIGAEIDRLERAIHALPAEGAADSGKSLEAAKRLGDKADLGRRARPRRLFRRFVAILTIFVVVAVLATCALAAAFTALVILGGAIVWILGLVISGLRASMHMLRIELGAIKDTREAECRARRRVEYPAQLANLEQRYQEFLDWAEVCGYLVHHPFERSLPSTPSVSGALTNANLPAAFTIGVAYLGEHDERIKKLANRVRSSVFKPGWLTRVLGRVGTAYQEAARREGFIEPGEVAPSPFEDDGVVAGCPRKNFLELVKQGVGRRIADQDAVGTLVKRLEKLAWDGEDGLFVSVIQQEDDGPSDGAVVRPQPALGVWRQQPATLDAIAEQIRPAVVRIRSARDGGQTVSGGSGVIISTDGLVVTNAHVTNDAESIAVTLHDGRELDAGEPFTSSTTDLALIPLPQGEYACAPVYDEADTPKVATQIVLYGYPRMIEGEPTFSWGLVTSGKQVIRTKGATSDVVVFQHDAAHSPGSSGSGVFDLEGSVVGVDCAGTEADSYMGFAVPAGDIRTLVGRQRSEGGGEVASPTIGGAEASSSDVVNEVRGIGFDDFMEAIFAEGTARFQRAHFTDNAEDDAGCVEVHLDWRARAPAGAGIDLACPLRVQTSTLELAAPQRFEGITVFSRGDSTNEDESGSAPPTPWTF